MRRLGIDSRTPGVWLVVAMRGFPEDQCEALHTPCEGSLITTARSDPGLASSSKFRSRILPPPAATANPSPNPLPVVYAITQVPLGRFGGLNKGHGGIS